MVEIENKDIGTRERWEYSRDSSFREIILTIGCDNMDQIWIFYS